MRQRCQGNRTAVFVGIHVYRQCSRIVLPSKLQKRQCQHILIGCKASLSNCSFSLSLSLCVCVCMCVCVTCWNCSFIHQTPKCTSNPSICHHHQQQQLMHCTWWPQKNISNLILMLSSTVSYSTGNKHFSLSAFHKCHNSHPSAFKLQDNKINVVDNYLQFSCILSVLLSKR